MNNPARIKITLTEKQWKIVDDNLNALQPCSLRFYIASELKRLQKLCDELPSKPCIECTDRSVQRAFRLPESSNAILENIAKKTGVNTPGLIISKFIIAPLILD